MQRKINVEVIRVDNHSKKPTNIYMSVEALEVWICSRNRVKGNAKVFFDSGKSRQGSGPTLLF